jgi:hypothetical protein
VAVPGLARHRHGKPHLPSGEAPASTVVRARVLQEREPAAERAAASGGRKGRGCSPTAPKATSESSVS